ncbi:MAG: YbhN family protein [Wujia sp.]
MSKQTEHKMIDKKSAQSSMVKWLVVLGLFAFVCIKNKTLMQEAVAQFTSMELWKLLLCIGLGNLYFVIEGIVISVMTKSCEKHLHVGQGIFCAYLCMFYRIATLGSGSGIAQVLYYNLRGIRASIGTGMSLVQYSFHKISIAGLGVTAFIGLWLWGDGDIQEYAIFMLAGAVVIGAICIFLIVVTVSQKFSDFVFGIGEKLIKKTSKLYPKLEQGRTSVGYLQEQGRIIWKDKKLFLTVIILDLIKLSCWYMIPGVYFAGDFSAPFVVCLALMAICNMVGCVMLAPSGIGTLDFVVTLFFTSVVADQSAIAAALVTYRIATWLVPFLIGVIPALFVKKSE